MRKKLIYGAINSAEDITEINKQIRKQLKRAKTTKAITELVKRSMYLITLSYAPAWKTKFGKRIRVIRSRAKKEFEMTARLGNRMREKMGLKPKYDVVWGNGVVRGV